MMNIKQIRGMVIIRLHDDTKITKHFVTFDEMFEYLSKIKEKMV